MPGCRRSGAEVLEVLLVGSGTHARETNGIIAIMKQVFVHQRIGVAQLRAYTTEIFEYSKSPAHSEITGSFFSRNMRQAFDGVWRELSSGSDTKSTTRLIWQTGPRGQTVMLHITSRAGVQISGFWSCGQRYLPFVSSHCPTMPVLAHTGPIGGPIHYSVRLPSTESALQTMQKQFRTRAWRKGIAIVFG